MSQKLLTIPIIVFAAALGVAGLFWTDASQAAGIYVCIDPDGSRHFTNLPESGRCIPFRSKKKSTFASVSRGADWGGYAAKGPLAYNAHIEYFGKHYKIDPNLIRAIIRIESGFDRYAVSSKGAQGLMQLMPETARELSVADPFDPQQNIKGGVKYFRSLLDLFDGDLTLSLAAYNAGPSLVKRINRVPRIPETVRYIRKVLACYEGYDKNGRVADASLYGASIRVRGLQTVQ